MAVALRAFAEPQRSDAPEEILRIMLENATWRLEDVERDLAEFEALSNSRLLELRSEVARARTRLASVERFTVRPENADS